MKYASLLFLVVSLFSCSQKKKKKEVEAYPVLETMGYYQRFSQKLWLAGINKNWELADFYTHELEEVTEHLIEGDVIHDDYNLSNLTVQMLLPKIEKVEEAIRQKDEVLFLDNYKLMISSCNLCHNTTKHNFIKITTPNDSSIWNQNFSLD
ncbi:hypothetical protein SAMN05421640_0529 [Ekhidna lutea]|uniref:Cytochrome C n=1 Tax=Ekhidna lutea TaxID=447679 RepID=A0A239F762_EKHLU|nr:hypothetical protein [Ekhidna lutea]SNS52769.1 hypothetical protein SAMN05421640_0529 [Ekhidna lutea]